VEVDLCARAANYIESRGLSVENEVATKVHLEKFVAMRRRLWKAIVRYTASKRPEAVGTPDAAFDVRSYVQTKLEPANVHKVPDIVTIIVTASTSRRGIVGWWASGSARRLFGNILPEICGYTLTMSPTTASTERLLSAVGLRISKLRNRMSAEKAVNYVKVTKNTTFACLHAFYAHAISAGT
jgi:hypothetical protein